MISSMMNDYLEGLISERSPLFKEMEAFARENEVPIMELVGIESMLQILRLQKPASILEIGTAIGYSALRMAEALPQTKIVTIERDRERYEKALYYIEQAEKGGQIQVIFGDALEVFEQVRDEGSYDAFFIDAAKGQYKRFFELYEQLLKPEGAIFTDNVLFKGLVAEETIENKRIRNLVSKIKSYNAWLMDHPQYVTAILPVGDGLAISKRRG